MVKVVCNGKGRPSSLHHSLVWTSQVAMSLDAMLRTESIFQREIYSYPSNRPQGDVDLGPKGRRLSSLQTGALVHFRFRGRTGGNYRKGALLFRSRTLFLWIPQRIYAHSQQVLRSCRTQSSSRNLQLPASARARPICPPPCASTQP